MEYFIGVDVEASVPDRAFEVSASLVGLERSETGSFRRAGFLKAEAARGCNPVPSE